MGLAMGTNITNVKVYRLGGGMTGLGTCDTPAGGLNSTEPIACSFDSVSQPDGPMTLAVAVQESGNPGVDVPAGGNVSIVVDNAAPTSAGLDVLADGTNPQYTGQSASQVWFNPGFSGSFHVTPNYTDGTGSGVDHYRTVSAPANWTPSSGNSPAGTVDYAWAPGALGGTITFVAVDAAGNESSPYGIMVSADTQEPAGGLISYPNGIQSTLNAASLNIDASPSDVGPSGNDTVQWQRSVGTLVNGSCTAYGVFANIAGLNPVNPLMDDTLVTGGCYKYRLVATDKVGNVGTTTSTSELGVDTTAPTGSLLLSEGTNPAAQFVNGSVLFFNPATTGSFTVGSSYADAQSGIAHAMFTAITEGWTPSGTGIMDTTAPYAQEFTWAVGAGSSAGEPVLVQNGAGLSKGTADTFSVTADTAAPIGVTVSAVASADETTTSVTLGMPQDPAGGSGIAGWVLARSSAPRDGTDCGPFGAFAPVGPASPATPFADTTVAADTCNTYRVTYTDNVGNATTATSVTPALTKPTPIPRVAPDPVTPDPVEPTDGTDEFDGGEGIDEFDGGAGDDEIDGGAGNDQLKGGAGNDKVLGGAGNDSVDGGLGNDTVEGGIGNDSVAGGAGNDIVDGGVGSDTVTGGVGNDVNKGGDGNDKITDTTGKDTEQGGAGNDSMTIGADGTRADGGIGNDTLTVKNGKRSAKGRLVIECGSGKDSVTVPRKLLPFVKLMHCEKVRLVG